MSDLEFTPQEPEQNEFNEPGASLPPVEQSSDEPTELFQSFSQPEVIPPTRIPHLGHLALFGAFLLAGYLFMMMVLGIALYFHWDGVFALDQIKTNVHYLLGSEAVLYLATLLLGTFLFPLFWHKSFFAGIHWRGSTALRLYWQLGITALGCFALATIDELLLPGPSNAPIDQIFRSPGAAWVMFGFGITIAPFFEEIAFRGILLPSLATACDWIGDRFTRQLPRPLDADGHPRWSISAMVIASIATSVPFALLHAEQTGRSIGPFLLLVTVSLVLCAVRLKTRSLAASTLVHACYNFLIFFFMLLGTEGFRHLDKM
jgi:hypothetical protein